MHYTVQLQGDEKTIIEACLREERWAQKAIYEAYYGVMMGVCLRYANCDQEALDILHEGYIKVFRHLERYQPGTSLYSWIKRIMVNTSIDYYRKESRRRTQDLDDAYNLATDSVSPISNMTKEEILKAIQTLSLAYRNVFNLYVIEGFSHREVAKKLNITESTSRSNLVKARSKLRDILSKKGIER